MLTAKEKKHYFKYTMHHGARWLASVMKARECTDPQVVSDYYLEAMMQVFSRMYVERTKGLEKKVDVNQWDLINLLRELGANKAESQPFYIDMLNAAAYEFDSKSRQYTFFVDIRYDNNVKSILYKMNGVQCLWSIKKIVLNTEQLYYLIKDFVEFMDELAAVAKKALEKARKILLVEEIVIITNQLKSSQAEFVTFFRVERT